MQHANSSSAHVPLRQPAASSQSQLATTHHATPTRVVAEKNATNCTSCRASFSVLFNKRNHCRLCGLTFCSDCCPSDKVLCEGEIVYIDEANKKHILEGEQKICLQCAPRAEGTKQQRRASAGGLLRHSATMMPHTPVSSTRASVSASSSSSAAHSAHRPSLSLTTSSTSHTPLKSPTFDSPAAASSSPSPFSIAVSSSSPSPPPTGATSELQFTSNQSPTLSEEDCTAFTESVLSLKKCVHELDVAGQLEALQVLIPIIRKGQLLPEQTATHAPSYSQHTTGASSSGSSMAVSPLKIFDELMKILRKENSFATIPTQVILPLLQVLFFVGWNVFANTQSFNLYRSYHEGYALYFEHAIKDASSVESLKNLAGYRGEVMLQLSLLQKVLTVIPHTDSNDGPNVAYHIRNLALVALSFIGIGDSPICLVLDNIQEFVQSRWKLYKSSDILQAVLPMFACMPRANTMVTLDTVRVLQQKFDKSVGGGLLTLNPPWEVSVVYLHLLYQLMRFVLHKASAHEASGNGYLLRSKSTGCFSMEVESLLSALFTGATVPGRKNARFKAFKDAAKSSEPKVRECVVTIAMDILVESSRAEEASQGSNSAEGQPSSSSSAASGSIGSSSLPPLLFPPLLRTECSNILLESRLNDSHPLVVESLSERAEMNRAEMTSIWNKVWQRRKNEVLAYHQQQLAKLTALQADASAQTSEIQALSASLQTLRNGISSLGAFIPELEKDVKSILGISQDIHKEVKHTRAVVDESHALLKQVHQVLVQQQQQQQRQEANENAAPSASPEAFQFAVPQKVVKSAASTTSSSSMTVPSPRAAPATPSSTTPAAPGRLTRSPAVAATSKSPASVTRTGTLTSPNKRKQMSSSSSSAAASSSTSAASTPTSSNRGGLTRSSAMVRSPSPVVAAEPANKKIKTTNTTPTSSSGPQKIWR